MRNLHRLVRLSAGADLLVGMGDGFGQSLTRPKLLRERYLLGIAGHRFLCAVLFYDGYAKSARRKPNDEPLEA